MKRIAKAAALTAMLLLCLLGGCIPQKYDKGKAERIEEQGRPLLEAYAASLPGGGEITALSMMIGYEEGGSPYTGSYLSNLVRARIQTPGGTVTAMANIKTREILTDRYMQDVNEAVRRQLTPYAEKASLSGLTVSGAELYGQVVSPGMETVHKGGAKMDTVVTYTDMLPADITEEDPEQWAALVLDNASLGAFTLRAEAKSGAFPGVRFLTDYLSDSGNVVKEDSAPFGAPADYRVTVTVTEDPQVLRWHMEGTLAEPLSDMTFTLRRADQTTEGAFTFLYDGARGSIGAFDSEPVLEEMGCPVTVEGDTLHYTGGGSCRLIFAEKPAYTEFERVLYKDGKPQPPEALTLSELPDGTYSLTNGLKDHENGYVFLENQEIRCR